MNKIINILNINLQPHDIIIRNILSNIFQIDITKIKYNKNENKPTFMINKNTFFCNNFSFNNTNYNITAPLKISNNTICICIYINNKVKNYTKTKYLDSIGERIIKKNKYDINYFDIFHTKIRKNCLVDNKIFTNNITKYGYYYYIDIYKVFISKFYKNYFIYINKYNEQEKIYDRWGTVKYFHNNIKLKNYNKSINNLIILI